MGAAGEVKCPVRFLARLAPDESAAGATLTLKPESDVGPRKHEGHETDGCESTLLRFIPFRVFVAINIGFGFEAAGLT